VAGRTVRLTAEQEGAVRLALGGAITVVSGGPGSGKTSIVVSLLRALVRLGLGPDAVALAAPTGRAAQRMSDATRRALQGLVDPAPEDAALLARLPAGQTLHRLLGLWPGRPEGTPGERLEQRVVIVDEASMIDLVLMERLARAAGAGARLVLLGDADQLPAVAAGAVLRDLVPAPGAPATRLDRRVVRLTGSHRVDAGDPQGAAILDLARGLQAQDDWRARLVVRDSAQALAFAGVELLAAPAPRGPTAALEALLARWRAERLEPLLALAARPLRLGAAGRFEPDDRARLEALLAGHDAARLLCFTRERRTGARGVDQAVHRLLLRARGVERGDAPALLPGEPLLVVKNDRERGLWNGDLGVAVRVARPGEPPRLMAAFRRGEELQALHLDLLGDLVERCHAMTVHKAQGAEVDHAVVVLPERDGPLVTREVLYTAVTRARRAVTIVGDEDLLARAAARARPRATGLRGLL
jgi:exodeoxyribonuclease V alpha subunit